MSKNKQPIIPLYEPLNTLKPVAENVWIADGGVIKMAMGLGVHFPFTTRMTIVRLADGGLWCHSPIVPTDELLEQVNQLGEVRHLVSPNKIHYAYISAWKEIFPQATAWASPQVRERAQSQNIPVTFDVDLTDDAPADWANDIEQLIFKGSQVMEEVVFFHKDSHTLILTDLIENFETDKVDSYPLRTLMKVTGISDPDGKAPVDFRATFIGHKDLARQTYEHMLAWQPKRIIIAHGRWFEDNAVEELKRAFHWVN